MQHATCLIQSSKVDYANYFKIPFPERKYDCGFMQKGDYTFVYFLKYFLQGNPYPMRR